MVEYTQNYGELDSLSPETLTESTLPGLIDAYRPKNKDICDYEFGCGQAQPGAVRPAQAFYFSDNVGLKCSQLADGGIFETSELVRQPLERKLEEVTALKVRSTSEIAALNLVPHFRVMADGTIKEIRDPEQKTNANDCSIVIEVEDGKGVEYSEKQKAALRQLYAFVKDNCANLIGTTEDLDAKAFQAICVEPTIEDEGGWPIFTEPSIKRHYWVAPEKGMLRGIFKEQQGRKCGEYDRVNQMSDHERTLFVDKVKKLISKNEGKYNSINLDDNGAGISVGIAQWNQKKGELPTLIREWYIAADKEHQKLVASGHAKASAPNRFERVFGQFAKDWLSLSNESSPGNESQRDKFIRDYNFVAETDEAKGVLQSMKKALEDPLFCGVQDDLVRRKVRRAIDLADRYGHHSTRFIAQVADVANQYGWGGCESILRKANVANIPEDTEGECLAIQSFIDNTPDKTNPRTGEPISRKNRDETIDREFPPKTTSRLRLVTKYVF